MTQLSAAKIFFASALGSGQIALVQVVDSLRNSSGSHDALWLEIVKGLVTLLTPMMAAWIVVITRHTRHLVNSNSEAQNLTISQLRTEILDLRKLYSALPIVAITTAKADIVATDAAVNVRAATPVTTPKVK